MYGLEINSEWQDVTKTIKIQAEEILWRSWEKIVNKWIHYCGIRKCKKWLLKIRRNLKNGNVLKSLKYGQFILKPREKQKG